MNDDNIRLFPLEEFYRLGIALGNNCFIPGERVVPSVSEETETQCYSELLAFVSAGSYIKSCTMDDDDIEKRAYQVVAQAQGQTIYLIGLPRNIGQLEDQSEMVDSFCTECGAPVQSTVLKEKILEIAKLTGTPAELRCGQCMINFFYEAK